MLVGIAPGALLWPAAMIVWGPGDRTSGHAHHCVQLVMALKGSLRVRNEPRDGWAESGAAIIKADVRHEVDAQSTPTLLAFVAVESSLGTALEKRAQGKLTLVCDDEVTRWREQLEDTSRLSAAKVDEWLRRELLTNGSIPPVHPGVRRVLVHLREHVGDLGSFKLSALAQVAELSSSRLMHAFTESVGVPLRPYVLWLRLQLASGELMRGRSVTEAAHSAGFADAAHMTRTFRRMLGTTPAELMARRDRTKAAFIESV